MRTTSHQMQHNSSSESNLLLFFSKTDKSFQPQRPRGALKRIQSVLIPADGPAGNRSGPGQAQALTMAENLFGIHVCEENTKRGASKNRRFRYRFSLTHPVRLFYRFISLAIVRSVIASPLCFLILLLFFVVLSLVHPL